VAAPAPAFEIAPPSAVPPLALAPPWAFPVALSPPVCLPPLAAPSALPPELVTDSTQASLMQLSPRSQSPSMPHPQPSAPISQLASGFALSKQEGKPTRATPSASQREATIAGRLRWPDEPGS
jgi:hypothetical protein